jgi:hypothetical protein
MVIYDVSIKPECCKHGNVAICATMGLNTDRNPSGSARSAAHAGVVRQLDKGQNRPFVLFDFFDHSAYSSLA